MNDLEKMGELADQERQDRELDRLGPFEELALKLQNKAFLGRRWADESTEAGYLATALCHRERANNYEDAAQALVEVIETERGKL